MSEEADLSYVDPRRIAEVRRRIAVVREYASLFRPSGADAKRYAAMLDMGPSNFSRLVKAWRERGRLPEGASAERRSHAAATSRRGLSDASRDAVLAAIDRLGVDARFTDHLNAARAACAAANVHCPSPGSIWSMIQKRRTSSTPSPVRGPAILLVRCSIDLKVEIGDRILVPDVMLAVALPEGNVVSATPLFEHSSPGDFGRIVPDIVERFGTSVDGRTLLADAVAMGGDDPDGIAARVTIGHPGDTGLRTLRRTIGPKLDTIALGASSKARVPRRLDRAKVLTRDQAEDAIAHAVRRHNSRVVALPRMRVQAKPSR